MNFLARLAVTAVAFTGLAAADDACSGSQTTTAYTTLAGLLSNSNLDQCSTDSGYNLLYATALPSDPQYVKMCAAASCKSLLSAVLALNPPDCVLSIPTSGLEMNIYAMASGFDAKCASLSSPTTTAPAPTTAAPATPSATPTTSTDTPSSPTATPSTTPAPSVATSC